MKKIFIICMIICLTIYSILFFYTFIYSRIYQSETTYLPDVYQTNIKESIDKLSDYNLEVIYVNSKYKEDEIIYTIPSKNRLVYKNQNIKIYVSNGIEDIEIKDLKYQYYEENIDYIDSLYKNYNIKINIENTINNDYSEGLIINQDYYGDLSLCKEITFTISHNKPLILIPNFIGMNIEEVNKYLSQFDIEVIYVYKKNNKPKNIVFAQSISANSLVMDNANAIYIFVSTG